MRAKPCTNKIYRFEEFDFLRKKDGKWTSKELEIDVEKIGKINGKNISPENYSEIYKECYSSLVGINKDTVLNRKIRSSKEITMDKLELNKDFCEILQKEVDEMLCDLIHPHKVKLTPHKLVCYGPGDFFKEHIDSVHKNNMIMSLSVQLPPSFTIENRHFYEKGGNLVVNGVKLPLPNKSRARLTLFYHDQKHEIIPVNYGYRASLVFDLIQLNDTFPTPDYTSSFLNGIDKLRKQNVTKIAFITNHNYIGQNISSITLKGIDKIGYDLFTSVCSKVYLRNICSNNSQQYYCQELLPIFQIEDSFSELYRNIDGNDSDDDITDKYKNYIDNNMLAIDKYDQIKLLFDENLTYAAVSNEYLLGDVVFLQSSKFSVKIYKGDRDIHLGNEGFYGDIYHNLAIIGYLS